MFKLQLHLHLQLQHMPSHLGLAQCLQHKKCIICSKQDTLKIIPLVARTKFFADNGFVIAKGSRCCPTHLDGKYLRSTEVAVITSGQTHFNKTELKELLEGLRSIAAKKSLDFDTPGVLTNDDYWRLTGMTIAQFDIILESIRNHLRSTSNRSARTVLAVFLTKLRCGLSYHVLSTLFALSKIVIKRCIHTVRKVLMIEFVPKYLGFAHISRDDFIRNHTRTFAKALFTQGEEKAIVVADGTYVYIEKSGNYRFQRRTYSMHKGRPLVKPMLIVSTTGYILEVLGPYFADGKNNDASIITSHMRSQGENLRNWLHQDDVVIVDRGFRDSVHLLEDLNLIVKMPHFLQGQSQHSTQEANESRLVTSVRWVVEASNGLLKTFKALAYTMPNSQVPYIGDYVRIVCSICNAFRPPRIVEDESVSVTAERMLTLSGHTNDWQNRVIWQEMTENDLTDFPRLTLEELKQLTIGIYQLKQADSYTTEHKDNQGLYKLFTHRECNDIIRVLIQSRHTSSKIYTLWIQYNQAAVTSWYCQCKVGARVVGCCAHVASVIWFLGYHRYREIQQTKHSMHYGDFIDDTATGWSDEGTDEEDNNPVCED